MAPIVQWWLLVLVTASVSLEGKSDGKGVTCWLVVMVVVVKKGVDMSVGGGSGHYLLWFLFGHNY